MDLTAGPGPDQALTAALLQLAAHAERLNELSARLDDLAQDDDAYTPSTTPLFWRLDGPDRDASVARLRSWVEQIYRPGYGYLARTLADCWEQHPLCLYLLDWLSELWSVLYLHPRRTAGTLAGQAEWHIRLVVAAAEQMHRETTRCPHANDRRTNPRATSWVSDRPGRPQDF
ncbi:MAG TPA: hypothetical protein VFI65_18800 [Streptosporangiaceae bacterium]|nr:hypothetical protein [Streptosporangiaceae bacterium]